MNFNEFKAWLEGFEASFSANQPNAEQWATVKAQLASVSVVTPALPATPETGKWPSIEPIKIVWSQNACLDGQIAGNVVETPEPRKVVEPSRAYDGYMGVI